jgi:membrane protease YdiL (CAAX protease family)
MTVSILLVLLTSALLVMTGLIKQPGIGVIGTLVAIILAIWLRGDGLPYLGLTAPDNWLLTVLLGLGLGIIIQLVSISLIEPVSERITGESHDHSIVEDVKGNWKALVQWLLIVWVFVALLEEVVYRGFLMTETARIIGTGALAVVINVAFTSLVFGLSHGYQSRTGIISTGVVGAILAVIFVWSDYNLWLPVFTHGFIDSVAIVLIAIDWDKHIRGLFYKSNTT